MTERDCSGRERALQKSRARCASCSTDRGIYRTGSWGEALSDQFCMSHLRPKSTAVVFPPLRTMATRSAGPG